MQASQLVFGFQFSLQTIIEISGLQGKQELRSFTNFLNDENYLWETLQYQMQQKIRIKPHTQQKRFNNEIKNTSETILYNYFIMIFLRRLKRLVDKRFFIF